MRYQTVVFDFDGTVADTAQGIFESVEYALRKMELPPAPTFTSALSMELSVEGCVVFSAPAVCELGCNQDRSLRNRQAGCNWWRDPL